MAVADYSGVAASRSFVGYRRRLGRGSFHLYPVLMKAQEDVKSQLVIVTGFLALSFLFHADILAKIALGLGLIFLISPIMSRGIMWLWWKLAHILGWINTRILLSLVFYLVLLPFALLSRLFSNDPLSLKWGKSGSSFVQRDHLYKGSDLENPW